MKFQYLQMKWKFLGEELKKLIRKQNANVEKHYGARYYIAFAWSCNKEPSLQKYFVENAKNKNFS
jgi:hypothetical protein